MNPTFLDFETASGADLRKVGGRVYANHPSTLIVCAHAIGPGGSVTLRYGDDVSTWAKEVVHNLGGDAIVAHNGDSFDKFIAAKHAPLLMSVPWIDTIHMARTGGLPASLQELAENFLGAGKHDAGHDLMLKMCKLVRNPVTGVWGNKWLQKGYIDVVTRYCVQDVELLQRVFPHVIRYWKPEAVALDNGINERGIGFDESLAAKIAECSSQLVAESGAEIERITNRKLLATDLRSVPKVSAWLAAQGVTLENLRKDTVKRFIEQSIETPVDKLLAEDEELSELTINEKVARVLQLRSSALRITASKLERASAVCVDGRIRDLRIHHGAHTGRRTGRVVQPHNLPGGVDTFSAGEVAEGTTLSLDEIRRFADHHGCSPDDILSSLIRPCFVPAPGNVFVIADFASVEARILAWLAGEESLLHTFRIGGDPYKTAASLMFGVPYDKVTKEQRKIGKVQILGCGYQAGANAIERFAVANRVDFSGAGLTALNVVEGYRDAFPNIAGVRTGSFFKGVACRRGGIWKALDRAFRDAMDDKTVHTNHLTFRKDGVNVEMVLPSGRIITYRKPGLEWRTFPNSDEPSECIVFTHPVRGRKVTSGGSLTENAAQGIGADLLSLAMQTSEDREYRPVLEVHDEVVCEVPEADGPAVLDDLIDIMSTTPEWGAPELPLSASGHVSPRYTKQPMKGWYHR